MVYLIQDLANGEVKIGYSKHPFTRQRQLECQLSKRDRVRLLIYMPGDIDLEANLHIEFASHRLHGEWFAKEATAAAVSRFLAITLQSDERQCHKLNSKEDNNTYIKPICDWITFGFFYRGEAVKLNGEIVWLGKRYANDGVYDDITGTRFSITDESLMEFMNKQLETRWLR